MFHVKSVIASVTYIKDSSGVIVTILVRCRLTQWNKTLHSHCNFVHFRNFPTWVNIQNELRHLDSMYDMSVDLFL